MKKSFDSKSLNKRCEDDPNTDNHETINQTFTEKHETCKRVTWNHQIEFLLTLVGYNVGYGNLWRFPYLCMRNGGGAFLIPYFFFLVVCGIPLFYLEVAVSQYSSQSTICLWNICPLFKGLGWGMVAISAIVAVYFNVIIAWALLYLVRSFSTVLPWSNCDNSWNTPGCLDVANLTIDTDLDWNITKYLTNFSGTVQTVSSLSDISNDTEDASPVQTWKMLTPGEEFWQYEVLHLSDGIEYLGKIRWQLLLCLMASWVIVFLCICKGIRSSGKVVYVTATAPYVFLTILLVRGVTLPGSLDGIKFYIIPDLKQLANFKVWGEACLQIFYTLGPCWGGLLTFGSYNKFHHNFLRDTIASSITCCGTSLYAGFVMFSIIGFMAKEANVEISKVVTSGPGLLFIVYPDALTKLPIAPLWSVLFFLLLLLVGLDCQFGTVETVVSGLVDRYPKYLARRKTMCAATLCFVAFLLGIPMVTEGGMYLFQITDWYSAAFSFIIIGFLESIVLIYVYGLSRIEHDIHMMLGQELNIFWKICWGFVTPLCLFGIIIFTIFVWQPPSYGDYQYPSWAITLGWLMATYSVAPIPILAIIEITKERGSLLQRIKKLLRPAAEWGPADPQHRTGSKYPTTDQINQNEKIMLHRV